MNTQNLDLIYSSAGSRIYPASTNLYTINQYATNYKLRVGVYYGNEVVTNKVASIKAIIYNGKSNPARILYSTDNITYSDKRVNLWTYQLTQYDTYLYAENLEISIIITLEDGKTEFIDTVEIPMIKQNFGKITPQPLEDDGTLNSIIVGTAEMRDALNSLLEGGSKYPPTSNVEPNSLVLRDLNSRAKIADPVDGKDIANKDFIESYKLNNSFNGLTQKLSDATINYTGRNPNATHYDSSLQGVLNTGASGSNSASLNGNTIATGSRALAVNNKSVAKADESMAGGYQSVTLPGADSSLAFGEQNITNGNSAVAFGNNTQALADHSFTYGYHNIASKACALAGGNTNEANGENSVALGVNTVADGDNSIAIGSGSYAGEALSLAFGEGVRARYLYQTAIGRFNENISGNLFEIGNGESVDAPRTVFSVTRDGRAKSDTLPSDNNDLTNKYYVDGKISELVNSAPEVLDTLNELSTALNNDPNFATNIVNALSTKLTMNTGTSTYSTLYAKAPNGSQRTYDATNLVVGDAVVVRESTGDVIVPAVPTYGASAVSNDHLKDYAVQRLTSTDYEYAYTFAPGGQTRHRISTSPDDNTIAVRGVNGVLAVGNPFGDQHAATKKYVDDSVRGATNAKIVAGDDINITLNSGNYNVSVAEDSFLRRMTTTEALNHGMNVKFLYGWRYDATAGKIVDEHILLSKDPYSGAVPLYNNKRIKTDTPSANDDCANKKYVDNAVSLYTYTLEIKKVKGEDGKIAFYAPYIPELFNALTGQQMLTALGSFLQSKGYSSTKFLLPCSGGRGSNYGAIGLYYNGSEVCLEEWRSSDVSYSYPISVADHSSASISMTKLI